MGSSDYEGSRWLPVLTTFGMGFRDDISEEDKWIWVRRGHDPREFSGL